MLLCFAQQSVHVIHVVSSSKISGCWSISAALLVTQPATAVAYGFECHPARGCHNVAKMHRDPLSFFDLWTQLCVYVCCDPLHGSCCQQDRPPHALQAHTWWLRIVLVCHSLADMAHSYALGITNISVICSCHKSSLLLRQKLAHSAELLSLIDMPLGGHTCTASMLAAAG